MPDYLYFQSDPTGQTVTGATLAEAADLAGDLVGSRQGHEEVGVYTYRIWMVPVTAVRAVDCTYRVDKRTAVTTKLVP